MEEKNELSFNCAESTMIGIDRDSLLEGFSNSCMRMASILGGGISGFGEVCGAVSGAVLSLGLILGTNGHTFMTTGMIFTTSRKMIWFRYTPFDRKQSLHVLSG